ncbi:galactinol-sucrose galactosyltransferase [Aureococcus anophagefferens]|uniref:Galactinol-sucrose galactosyltransferase n=1 Tax=Aureococcus anophagefferens TaxID=44056 RepID=A0ABR1GFH1_AURAN
MTSGFAHVWMAWLCVGGALQIPSRHTSHRALYAASVAVPAPRAPAGGGAAVRGDGSVVVGGATVLEPGARRLRRAVALGDAEVGREAEAGGGVFLSFGLRRRARAGVDLGYLPQGRLLSVARNKRWRGGEKRTRLILRCESGDGAVAAADLDGAVRVSATRSGVTGCVRG